MVQSRIKGPCALCFMQSIPGKLYCWADLMQPLPYKDWLIVRSHLHCSIKLLCNPMVWLSVNPSALPLDKKKKMCTPGFKSAHMITM